MNPLEKPSTRKSRKKPWLYLILLIPLLLIGFLLVNQPSSKSLEHDLIPPDEEVNPIVTEEVFIPEEVIPDAQTEFFSKEEGKALLYYAVVNDSVKFFKTEGVEPTTGISLLPVTQEIIKQYQASIEPKKEMAVVDTREYNVNEVKIIKKKEKPKPKKPKRESIWNTSVLNSATDDEVSLFVFNESNELDPTFMKKLKTEFEKKEYIITDEIIFSDMMNPEIAKNLKTANTKYFDYNLKKYTDYICIGTLSHSYAENAYRNDLLDCTLKINYFIYDAATGQQMFSEEDQLIGSGQTKETARKEAIQKFIL